MVFALAAVAGLKLWADHYLRSDGFRRFVGAKLSSTLKAETDLAPFQYQGLTVFSDHLEARGTLRAPFARLRMDHLRAVFSTRRIWEGVWQIEELEVAKLEVALEGTRTVEPVSADLSNTKGPGSSDTRITQGWLPNRVEIGTAGIKDATLTWKDGRLAGTALQVKPADGGWEIGGTGGSLAHGSLPKLSLDTLRVRYREPFLFVQNVDLRDGSGGSLNVTGEVQMKERLALLAKVTRLPIGPLLPEDWRVRLRGNLSGEINIHTPLPVRSTPSLSGTVHLTEGLLEALPVLDEIAAFTRTAQFRRIPLTRATGTFQRDQERLTVRDFVAESAGLIRLEGGFQVEGERIDGAFEVGVTPSSLQWLPGSQARVFTVARDGYLWAPMRLTGPLEKPIEDLSPRLIAAAQGALIDQATGTARDVLDTAKEAAKGALDLLLGR